MPLLFEKGYNIAAYMPLANPSAALDPKWPQPESLYHAYTFFINIHVRIHIYCFLTVCFSPSLSLSLFELLSNHSHCLRGLRRTTALPFAPGPVTAAGRALAGKPADAGWSRRALALGKDWLRGLGIWGLWVLQMLFRAEQPRRAPAFLPGGISPRASCSSAATKARLKVGSEKLKSPKRWW